MIFIFLIDRWLGARALRPRFYDVTEGAIQLEARTSASGPSSSSGGGSGSFQDTLLFSARAAENIALGRPGATREEVEREKRHASQAQRLPEPVLREAESMEHPAGG